MVVVCFFNVKVEPIGIANILLQGLPLLLQRLISAV